MAILSHRAIKGASRAFFVRYGARLRFMDLSGRVAHAEDWLRDVSATRRRRCVALQESLNSGASYVFEAAPGVTTFLVVAEDRRMVHGALLGPEVRLAGSDLRERSVAYLVSHGMRKEIAWRRLAKMPEWPAPLLREAAEYGRDLFYSASRWRPELMDENRLKAQQMAQINQAVEDLRTSGRPALYAFEKERALLAHIRAGDQAGARQILNEMLAIIYMSSPKQAVLRARAVELMSCLTRAAIEDNPLMEPLIERNHAWTERLIVAASFEDMSAVLTRALDEFMDDIYLQGVNRTNAHVQKAMDYIVRHFDEPIRLARLAQVAGASVSRLSHLIKIHTGRTFLQALYEVRVRHAQQLLRQSSKSCTEIAYEVGFGDQSYFIKHFKRLTGTTPARYRRVRG